jgi:hypothetical protein
MDAGHARLPAQAEARRVAHTWRRRLLQCGGNLGGGAAGSTCAARTLTTKSWSIDSAALSSKRAFSSAKAHTWRRRLLQCGGNLGGGAAESTCAARTLTTKSWSIDSAALSSKRAFSSAKSVQLDRSRTTVSIHLLLEDEEATQDR